MRAIVIFCFCLAASMGRAQTLQLGDVVLATDTGYTHIRSQTAQGILPLPGGGMTMSTGNFGNGSLLYIPGTDYVLVGENGINTSGLWLLDFSSGINSPTSHHLASLPAGVLGMTLDRSNGDVFFVDTGWNVWRIPGPIGFSSTPAATPYATGQTGTVALEVLPGGQLLAANYSSIYVLLQGATAPGPAIFTGIQFTDLRYDPLNNRLFVALLGLSRIDTYDLQSATFLQSPLSLPQLLVCECVDYNESTDTVYAISRINSQIGGVAWGAIPGNDNVIVSGSSMGPSGSATGVSPQTGHGNSGNYPYFVLVREASFVTNTLELDPATSSVMFDGTTGTFSATATVQTVFGLPTISSAAIDPLVGATITLGGTYTGTDTTYLSDIVLSAVTLEVHQATPPPGTPESSLVFSSTTNSGNVASYSGTLLATPESLRRFNLGTSMGTTTPAASTALAVFAARTATSDTHLEFGILPSELRRITFVPQPGLTAFETRMATSGNGDFELGTINALPGAHLFNLFTQLISIPTGSGPFLGLAPDPFLFSQVQQPLGVQPFHVSPDLSGRYHFSLPPGTIPAGILMDHLTIEANTATGSITPLLSGHITF